MFMNCSRTNKLGVPEVLKHFCSTRVVIVIGLRQARHQARANEHKFLFYFDAWSVVSQITLRWETREKGHVKSSCQSLSLPLLHRFSRWPLWSFPPGQPVCRTYFSFSFSLIFLQSAFQKKSGLLRVILAVTGPSEHADGALFGNVSQHCLLPVSWLCGRLVLPTWIQFSLPSSFSDSNLIFFSDLMASCIYRCLWPGKIAEKIGGIDAATMQRVEGLVSRAVSSVTLNACYRNGIAFRTLQYKTYAHSLLFGA